MAQPPSAFHFPLDLYFVFRRSYWLLIFECHWWTSDWLRNGYFSHSFGFLLQVLISNSLLDTCICMSHRHWKTVFPNISSSTSAPIPMSAIYVQGIFTYPVICAGILALPFLLIVPNPTLQSIEKFPWSPSNRCKKNLSTSLQFHQLSWWELLTFMETIWKHDIIPLPIPKPTLTTEIKNLKVLLLVYFFLWHFP